MAGLVGRADVGPEPLLAAAAAPADTVMDPADTSSTASLAEAAAPAANTDVAISDSFLAKADGVPPADVQVLDSDSVLDNGGDLLSASNFPLRARRKRIFTELEPGLGGPVAKRSRKPSTAPGAQKATVRKKRFVMHIVPLASFLACLCSHTTIWFRSVTKSRTLLFLALLGLATLPAPASRAKKIQASMTKRKRRGGKSAVDVELSGRRGALRVCETARKTQLCKNVKRND